MPGDLKEQKALHKIFILLTKVFRVGTVFLKLLINQSLKPFL